MPDCASAGAQHQMGCGCLPAMLPHAQPALPDSPNSAQDTLVEVPGKDVRATPQPMSVNNHEAESQSGPLAVVRSQACQHAS